MSPHRISLLLAVPILTLGIMGTAVALAGDASNSVSYAYATNGIKDDIVDRAGIKWKLLVDDSNLGGKELAMVEATFPPGTIVGSHKHRSVEIIYVLSGTYLHEVNGKLYRLTPGMVGIVRPGD